MTDSLFLIAVVQKTVTSERKIVITDVAGSNPAHLQMWVVVEVADTTIPYSPFSLFSALLRIFNYRTV